MLFSILKLKIFTLMNLGKAQVMQIEKDIKETITQILNRTTQLLKSIESTLLIKEKILEQL